MERKNFLFSVLRKDEKTYRHHSETSRKSQQIKSHILPSNGNFYLYKIKIKLTIVYKKHIILDN